MNVVSLYGRFPACMFKPFLLILWFDIYALTLSNVACLNFFFFPKLYFIAFFPDPSVHAISLIFILLVL